MTTNTDPSALVSQFFAANPTATTSDVAKAVKSIGGLGAVPGLTDAIAQHYGTTSDVVNTQYNTLTAPAVSSGTTGGASSGISPFAQTVVNADTANNIPITGGLSSISPNGGISNIASNSGLNTGSTANNQSQTGTQQDFLSQYNSQTQQGIKNAGLDTLMAQVNSGANASDILSQGLTPHAVSTYKDASGNVVTAPPNTYVVSKPDGSGGTLNYFFQVDPSTGKATPIANPSQNLTYTGGSSGGWLKSVASSLGPLADIALAVTGNGEFIPLVSGATTYAQTGNLGKALTSGLLSEGAITAAPLVGNAVSSATSDALGSVGSKLAAGAASALTGAEIATQGKADALTALVSGGISAAVPLVGAQIPGYSDLSAAGKAAVNKVIGGTLAGQSTDAIAINAAIAAGAQEVKNQIGSSSTGTSGTSGTTTTGTTGGSSNVATVNAGTSTGGSEVIDPNSVTNAATVASSAKPGDNSEKFGQYTNASSAVDINNAPIDVSKLVVGQPVVSTDPNTGIKTSITLEDNKDVTQVVTDPVLQTQEVTTTSPDGSKVVETTDKVTGLYTVDTYDAEGNLISSNSSTDENNSDVKLNKVTVTGGDVDTNTGDLVPLKTVNLSDGKVTHVDLTVTPSITPSVTPEITPSVTPSVTPQVTPSVTPVITPVVTPKVTPVTPSVTPSITPSITPSGGGGGTTNQNITTVLPASNIAGNISGPGPNPITESLLKSMMENPAKYQNVLQQVENLSQEQNIPMIDPKLAQLLQSLQGPKPKSGLQNDWFTYGQAPTSVDKILGLGNLNSEEAQTYKTGGHVEPLAYKKGGLPVVDGRHDFRAGAHVAGDGDGTSDDIPAMLADGEFVFPADVVAALGNGSTKAGTDKLYEMMHGIRARARSAKPGDIPPDALKSPLDYLKGKKQ